MLEVSELTRTIDQKTTVDHLTFTAPDAAVTGFIGPNGAGKSTTLRMCLGLEHPNSGTATFDGHPFSELAEPGSVVGALVDSTWFLPQRSAYSHVAMITDAMGLPTSRAREVLEMVGLDNVSGKKIGQFSLGMKQRLGIACALVGDPKHILLDEPVNGLDPEGIDWVHRMLRRFADEGRCVLISSHLLEQVEHVADHVVMLGRGRLIREGDTQELLGSSMLETSTPRASELVAALQSAGIDATADGETVRAHTDDKKKVASVAYRNGIDLDYLTPVRSSLQDLFLSETKDAAEYRAQ